MSISLLASQFASAGINDQLRELIIEKRAQMPAYSAVKQKIFEAEVLADPQKFVKNFKTLSTGKISAEIDWEKIENHVAFSGKGKCAIFVDADIACSSCVAQKKSVALILIEKARTRGFDVIDLSQNKTLMSATFEQVAEAAREKGADSLIWVSWVATTEPAKESHGPNPPVSDLYWNSVLVSDSDKISKSDTRSTIFYRDQATVVSSQLFAKALNVQSEIEDTTSAILGDSGESVKIRVSGIRSYADYQKARSKLGALLGKKGNFVESEMAVGEVIFSVTGYSPGREVASDVLGEMKFEVMP